uniref:RAP domain-containing protein n=1 Tax=Chromera velia CCMP2878 TaxID=1169474 RepID=A0A0G4F0X1_9ALVE|eukprot:Cvel_14406.t1-p1 / transcript=Cvel_14406.t1 / gene=Cvel_14406 / organism=Chromera_velia_CCMP2878 / gene_product=hypothetical protein / transcript_product=hypothetical protein / location=Cvel_scaffold1024:3137-8989(-) / protein_length=1125 / sequence_SO=supercontig / SO=protein_coding / is_pseudo=false
MEYPDKDFFKTAEPFVLREMPTMTPMQLATVVQSFAKAKFTTDVLCNELFAVCTQTAHLMGAEALVGIGMGAARSRYMQVQTLQTIFVPLRMRLHELAPSDLCRALWCYARWPNAALDDSFFLEATSLLTARLKAGAEKEEGSEGGARRAEEGGGRESLTLSLSDIERAVWAGGTLLRGRPEFAELLMVGEKLVLKELKRGWEEGRKTVGLNVVSTFAWALGRELPSASGFVGSVEFWGAVKRVASESLFSASNRELAVILLALSRSLGRNLADDFTVDTDFHQLAEKELMRRSSSLTSHELSEVALSYASVRSGSPQLFASLQKAALSMMESPPEQTQAATMENQGGSNKSGCAFREDAFSPVELGKVLLAFGTFRAGMKLFIHSQTDVLQRIHQFTPYRLCGICWAYAVMRFFDQTFWAALLTALPPPAISGDFRCGLLFPALCELERVHRELSLSPHKAILERYKGYAREGFWAIQEAEHPLEFAQQVASVLRTSFEDAGWPACDEDKVSAADGPSLTVREKFDLEGFLVDVLVETREGTRVAVLCHTPLSLHRTTNEPLGSTVLRDRQLKWRRVRTVNLWINTWKHLGEDNEGRRASFLKQKVLRALQAPAPRAPASLPDFPGLDVGDGFEDVAGSSRAPSLARALHNLKGAMEDAGTPGKGQRGGPSEVQRSTPHLRGRRSPNRSRLSRFFPGGVRDRRGESSTEAEGRKEEIENEEIELEIPSASSRSLSELQKASLSVSSASKDSQLSAPPLIVRMPPRLRRRVLSPQLINDSGDSHKPSRQSSSSALAVTSSESVLQGHRGSLFRRRRNARSRQSEAVALPSEDQAIAELKGGGEGDQGDESMTTSSGRGTRVEAAEFAEDGELDLFSQVWEGPDDTVHRVAAVNHDREDEDEEEEAEEGASLCKFFEESPRTPRWDSEGRLEDDRQTGEAQAPPQKGEKNSSEFYERNVSPSKFKMDLSKGASEGSKPNSLALGGGLGGDHQGDMNNFSDCSTLSEAAAAEREHEHLFRVAEEEFSFDPFLSRSDSETPPVVSIFDRQRLGRAASSNRSSLSVDAQRSASPDAAMSHVSAATSSVSDGRRLTEPQRALLSYAIGEYEYIQERAPERQGRGARERRA